VERDNCNTLPIFKEDEREKTPSKETSSKMIEGAGTLGGEIISGNST